MDILPEEHFRELDIQIQHLQKQYRVEKQINDLKKSVKFRCETEPKKYKMAIYDETSTVFAICSLRFYDPYDVECDYQYQNIEFEEYIENDEIHSLNILPPQTDYQKIVGIRAERTKGIIPAYKIDCKKLIPISVKTISRDSYICECNINIPIRFLPVDDVNDADA